MGSLVDQGGGDRWGAPLKPGRVLTLVHADQVQSKVHEVVVVLVRVPHQKPSGGYVIEVL